ncbi:MAG: hypothetical protein ACKOEM_13750 [Planctomycetia bacterium]
MISPARPTLTQVPLADLSLRYSEVEAALVLFDEIERLAEMPMANEASNAMLERIDLRIGLYFEDAMKGKRPVRKVAKGIQKSRRVATTMFRWMPPTRPRQLVMATDGKVGPPERSPRELFRLVHNWN